MPDHPVPGVVHVIYANVDDVSSLAWICSPEEHRRAFTQEGRRAQEASLATAGLLREAVAMLTGIPPASVDVGHWCRICRKVGDHGRPVAFDPRGLTLPGVYLSAARAGDLAVVAASAAAPVGIDIEPAKVRIELDTSILTPAEISDLNAMDSLERWQAWERARLRKRALGKATGFGDGVKPATLDVLGGVLRSWPGTLEDEVGGGVQLVNVAGLPDDYFGALAYLGTKRPMLVTTRTAIAS